MNNRVAPPLIEDADELHSASSNAEDAWLRALMSGSFDDIGRSRESAIEHAPREPHPGKIVDGKYRLGALLGQGGMGWVFEATHLQTERQVALKYLRPALRSSEHCVRRFGREASAAGRIEHPNVISVYDVGGSGRDFYIVMERLRGETLRARLARGPLPLPVALALTQRVMRGVAEAHRKGIIHRDLKPENIMLTALPDGTPGQPKVLDFGLSYAYSAVDIPRTESSGSSGFAVGTPHYMPLEQLRGEEIDVRADVYALGVVLYEALTGERPFRARSREDFVACLLTHSPAPLQLRDEAASVQLDAILRCALAPERSARFGSVTELALALSEVGRPGALPTSIASVREAAWLRGVRQAFSFSLAGLCLLLPGFDHAIAPAQVAVAVPLAETAPVARFAAAAPPMTNAAKVPLVPHARPIAHGSADVQRPHASTPVSRLPAGAAVVARTVPERSTASGSSTTRGRRAASMRSSPPPASRADRAQPVRRELLLLREDF